MKSAEVCTSRCSADFAEAAPEADGEGKVCKSASLQTKSGCRLVWIAFWSQWSQ